MPPPRAGARACTIKSFSSGGGEAPLKTIHSSPGLVRAATQRTRLRCKTSSYALYGLTTLKAMQTRARSRQQSRPQQGPAAGPAAKLQGGHDPLAGQQAKRRRHVEHHAGAGAVRIAVQGGRDQGDWQRAEEQEEQGPAARGAARIRMHPATTRIVVSVLPKWLPPYG